MGNCRGFALAAAMMILALLSVLGAAAIQSSTLEVQISSRDQDARSALYVAESALEEARYYAARGWGKVEVYGTNQVRVATPSLPGLDWSDGRYQGFSLADSRGERFHVSSYTSAGGPVITVDGGTPAAGRFLLFRENIQGTWDGNRLNVAPTNWAPVSGTDLWKGWFLWDAGTTPPTRYTVRHSDTDLAASPPSGWLEVSPTPIAPLGPFLLSLNPWLSALEAGLPLSGDGDGGTAAVWDRVFYSGTGQELGRSAVSVRLIPSGAYAGAYELKAVGSVDRSRQEASLHIFYAGLPGQRMRDWRVR